MNVGIPKEQKVEEYRVGLIPEGVRELTQKEHSVYVEKGAGVGVGITDDEYKEAGATITDDLDLLYGESELIIKVKEPLANECKYLRSGQTLFTYLHLAPTVTLTELLIDSGCTAIAYETVTSKQGGLPLLAPMSEVAGRMSVQAGAHSLEKPQGGRGVLLSGVPGVVPATVVIIGGGVVGSNAARIALGMQASVIILDKSLERLVELDQMFQSKIKTIFSTQAATEEHVLNADLVIGAVLVPGATAPKLVSEKIIEAMRAGSVMVDVAIDQGGCFETSRPTTHSDPSYVVHDVVHYCVANMPGAVPRTATYALNNATIPFVLEIAQQGVVKALQNNEHLRAGLHIHKGHITYSAVAEAVGKPYTSPEEALKL